MARCEGAASVASLRGEGMAVLDDPGAWGEGGGNVGWTGAGALVRDDLADGNL